MDRAAADARGSEALLSKGAPCPVDIIDHQIERRFGAALRASCSLRDDEMRAAAQLEHGELVIARDKTGAGRRLLLPAQTVALFKEMVRSKHPAAPLFSRADGVPWNKDSWKWPIKEAAQAAGLPAGATAYTLRHSTITDLVTGGLDLLTVAQVSGTSVAMIEKHYGHLQRERAAQALASLAL